MRAVQEPTVDQTDQESLLITLDADWDNPRRGE